MEVNGLFISFAIGIVSSYLGSYIYLRFQLPGVSLIKKILIRLFRIELDNFYNNRKESEIDFEKELKNTRKLKILSVRASKYAASTEDSMKVNWKTLASAQILVLNPYSKAGVKRALEVQSVARPEWHISEFAEDIFHNAEKFCIRDKVEMRFYNTSTAFRLIINDMHAYLSGFPENRLGKEVPVYRFCVQSDTYRYLEKYFDEIWSESMAYDEFLELRSKIQKNNPTYPFGIDQFL